MVVSDDHHAIGEVIMNSMDPRSNEVDILALIQANSTTLRFPEKLMLMLTHVERECRKRGDDPEKACISWTREGDAIIIRDQDELVRHILSRNGRFASFTRKLYRWGFRQTVGKSVKRATTTTASSSSSSSSSLTSSRNNNGAAVKVFFHKYFHRDNQQLMGKMKSMTAERARKEKLLPIQDRHLQGPQPQQATPTSLATIMNQDTPNLLSSIVAQAQAPRPSMQLQQQALLHRECLQAANTMASSGSAFSTFRFGSGSGSNHSLFPLAGLVGQQRSGGVIAPPQPPPSPLSASSSSSSLLLLPVALARQHVHYSTMLSSPPFLLSPPNSFMSAAAQQAESNLLQSALAIMQRDRKLQAQNFAMARQCLESIAPQLPR